MLLELLIDLPAIAVYPTNMSQYNILAKAEILHKLFLELKVCNYVYSTWQQNIFLFFCNFDFDSAISPALTYNHIFVNKYVIKSCIQIFQLLQCADRTPETTTCNNLLSEILTPTC